MTSSRRRASTARAFRRRVETGQESADIAGTISSLSDDLSEINATLKGTYPPGLNIPAGLAPGLGVVQQFGRSGNLGTSYTPVAPGEAYRMPQVGSATQLRVKAGGNANDDAAGTGAQEITVQGLLADGSLYSEEIATAGASASSATISSFIRIFRAWVSASGSYGDETTGSQAADIVIEDSAGTQDWLTISSDSPFGDSQSEIACYSVPLGYNAYIVRCKLWGDGATGVDLGLFQRRSILDTSAPYQAVRVSARFSSVQGLDERAYTTALGPFPELTDLVWMGKVGVGTGSATVDFEIILAEN